MLIYKNYKTMKQTVEFFYFKFQKENGFGRKKKVNN